MSTYLTYPKHVKDDSNNDKQKYEYEEKKSKSNLFDNKKVQNTMIINNDLSKSDEQIKDCDCERTQLDESSNITRASWKNCDSLADDICTITATDNTSSSLHITSIDEFFNRKRGRPLKNRFVEVYKNTHQKPQAIFTSFKLEKQSLTERGGYLCIPAQICVDNLKDCGNDNNYESEIPRHKPLKENSRQRTRFSKVNTALLPYTINSNRNFNGQQNKLTSEKFQNPFATKPDDEAKIKKNYHMNLYPMSTQGIATKVHNNVEESSISFSFNSERVPKKPKFCRTAESITVIRAAGTFFPENCKGTSSNDLIQKSPNIIQENQSILTYGCDVAENLSLKDRTEINVTNTSASSASLLTTTTRSSSVLPQIYSALQMQQQLFTFYQQIAFMMATFSHLQPSLTAKDSPHTTLPSITSTDLLQNKHLINMIFNLQKARLQQNNYGELCISGSKSDPPCLRQVCKKSSLSTAITRTTKDNNRSQNITMPQGHCGSIGRTTCGYLRFRFSEDCGFENCGYRRHQSHFHCNRPDCQYSFCDKARFVQHTARHERLDTLLGCDFQQYRPAVICNYSHCPYALSMTGDLNYIINNRKSSHFHCLKCPFVCADTNKVVAHRRLHSKMEFVRLAGFRKVYSKENCKATNSSCDPRKDNQITIVAPSTKEHSDHINKEITPSHCPYAMRHTHYHCLICDCSVLSKSQLLHHKHFKSVTYSTTRVQALKKKQVTTSSQ